MTPAEKEAKAAAAAQKAEEKEAAEAVKTTEHRIVPTQDDDACVEIAGQGEFHNGTGQPWAEWAKTHRSKAALEAREELEQKEGE